jgi:DNA recombination protein RmuC
MDSTWLPYALAGLAGIALGAVAAWLLAAAGRARAAGLLEMERARRIEIESQLATERRRAEELGRQNAVANERAERAQATIEEERRFLETTRRDLEGVFRSLAASTLEGTTQQFLTLAEQRFATANAAGSAALDERKVAIEHLLAPMRESLSRLDEKTHDLERLRVDAYSRLETQVQQLHATASLLQDRTTSLATALRGGSQARGRWAEITLRNLVEIAGLTEHCDFEEQQAQDGARPDLVVRLPGKRFLAVDAKAPMNAYYEAHEAADEATRKLGFARHARALQDHVKKLADREYGRKISGSLDVVVMFLPGEPFLTAAFAEDPDLQLRALRSRVLLTTPATLLALLRTAAHLWQEGTLAENAQRIGEVAHTLYERVANFAEHLGRVGKHLEQTNRAYNDAVGSFDTRLRPLGGRLEELKVAEGMRKKIETPQRVEDSARGVASWSETKELPFGGDGDVES